MDIRFIAETSLEKEKEELAKIIKMVKKKPSRYSKEADFLRQFIQAVIKKHPEVKQKEKIPKFIQTPINTSQIPIPIGSNKLQIPTLPQIPKTIQIPKPL